MWYVAFKLVPFTSRGSLEPAGLAIHASTWLLNNVSGTAYDRVSHKTELSFKTLGQAKSLEQLALLFASSIKAWHEQVDMDRRGGTYVMPNRVPALVLANAGVPSLYRAWKDAGWNLGAEIEGGLSRG